MRDLVEAPLKEFGVIPNRALVIDRSSGSLNELFGKAIMEIDGLIDLVRPACVVGQGDTSSVAAASLAAFHKRIPFIHVEAGLRTGNFEEPFPEELNRRIAGLTSSLHCAPTERSRDNLLREGANPADCLVTGNTVIDALLQTASRRLPSPRGFPESPKVILATAHRRESFGAPLEEALTGLRAAVDMYDDVGLFFLTHPNPQAHEPAKRILGGHPRITVTDAVGYTDLVAAMKRCWIVVTDSGGLQEEAPALGKPVLVLRDVTERPEAVEAGAVRIVGTDALVVMDEICKLHDDSRRYAEMAIPVFPYGDGRAAERIVEAMRLRLAKRAPVALDFLPN